LIYINVGVIWLLLWKKEMRLLVGVYFWFVSAFWFWVFVMCYWVGIFLKRNGLGLIYINVGVIWLLLWKKEMRLLVGVYFWSVRADLV